MSVLKRATWRNISEEKPRPQQSNVWIPSQFHPPRLPLPVCCQWHDWAVGSCGTHLLGNIARRVSSDSSSLSLPPLFSSCYSFVPDLTSCFGIRRTATGLRKMSQTREQVSREPWLSCDWRWSQVRSSGVGWGRVESGGVGWGRVASGGVGWRRVESGRSDGVRWGWVGSYRIY
jgi:hypothetical protein